MKKILYFIDDLSMGGIQKLALDWVSNFDKKKIKIDFLLLDKGINYELESTFQQLGSNVYKLKGVWINTPFDYIKYCKSCSMFFKEHNDYDIVELHSSSKNFLILKYAKKYGIKTRIAHSHNIGFQTKNMVKIFIGNILKYELKKYSTDFLACSKDAGRWLFGNKIINSDKFDIIYNSIDFNKFVYNQKVRQDIRNTLKISDDTFVVGHIGRFNEQKNHMFLIHIFEEILKINSDSKLLLLGDGILKDEINKYVISNNLSDKIYFMGIKTNVNEYLQAMDAFVFPSLYEGLGIVLIEAQASGLKVYTSKNVVPIEANISDTLFNYIDLKSNNYKEWAEKVLYDRNGYSRNNLVVNKGNYDLNSTIKKLEDYYLSRGDEYGKN